MFINNSPTGCRHNCRFFTTKGGFARTLPYPTVGSDGARKRTLFFSPGLYGHRDWISDAVFVFEGAPRGKAFAGEPAEWAEDDDSGGKRMKIMRPWAAKKPPELESMF